MPIHRRSMNILWERLTDNVWNDIEWVKAARSKPAHPLMLLHILVAKA